MQCRVLRLLSHVLYPLICNDDLCVSPFSYHILYNNRKSLSTNHSSGSSLESSSHSVSSTGDCKFWEPGLGLFLIKFYCYGVHFQVAISL